MDQTVVYMYTEQNSLIASEAKNIIYPHNIYTYY